MKLLNKKEERRSVGRPKLADTKLKKQSLIMLAVCLSLALTLLFTGAYSLNIINFGKMKGEVRCTGIPLNMQPRSESNPNGLEYGFTDLNFYNAVVDGYSMFENHCNDMDIDKLASITRVSKTHRQIENASGIQNLISINYLDLSYNLLTNIDLSHNNKLEYIKIYSNNLVDISLPPSETLTTLNLGSGDSFYSDGVLYNGINKLTSIDLSGYPMLKTLNLRKNIMSDIDLSHNDKLEEAYLQNNPFLTSVDISNNPSLIKLDLSPTFDHVVMKDKEENLNEKIEVKTAYPNDREFKVDDVSIATYEDGVIRGISAGTTSLLVSYKINDNYTYDNTSNILVYDVFSDKYVVNKNNNTIDLAGDTLESSDSNIHTTISKSRSYEGNILSIGQNVWDYTTKKNVWKTLATFELINYKLYELTSDYYLVDYENKTIDLKGDTLGEVTNAKFAITPYNYKININENELKITKQSGFNTTHIDTYTFKNAGIFSLKSAKYLINNENKTIDLKGDLLNIKCPTCNWNVNDYLELRPYDYTKEFSNDKLLITKDGDTVATYTLTNYSLYDLSVNTDYYSINKENKTIDANGNIYTTNYIYFNNSNNYKYDAYDDKYVIKDDNGNVVDTYTIINYQKGDFDSKKELGISSDLYTKCVQTSKYPGAVGSYPMTKEEINGITSLWCENKGITDTTGLDKLVNLEELGLSDNQITNIVGLDKLSKLTSLDLGNNKLTSIDLSKNTQLEELNIYFNNLSGTLDLSQNEKLVGMDLSYNKINNINLSKSADIMYVYLLNNKIQNLDLSYYKNLEELYVNDNELTNLALPKSEKLRQIYAYNNKLTTLDLGGNTNLEELYVQHNNLSAIKGLSSIESLGVLVANNNNLSSVDLSDNGNLMGIVIDSNPLTDTIYMVKGETKKYNQYISFSNPVTYELEDNPFIKYEDGVINALSEGDATIYMYVENVMSLKGESFDMQMYCDMLDSDTDEYKEKCEGHDYYEEGYQEYVLSNKIVVYDISSDSYVIDKDNKTIDANKQDIDVNKINVSEGLTVKVSGADMYIMDGDKVAVKYTVLNPKEDVSPTKDETPTIVNKNTKNDSDGKAKEVTDIYLKGAAISHFALNQIKGTDRNIIVENGIFTFTINGKDAEDINGDINLKATIKKIEDSIIYNQINDRVDNGVVLDFRNDNDLPLKMKVEIKVPNNMIDRLSDKFNVYSYNDNLFNLIAKDISLNDGKVTFYVRRLGYYVLTKDKIDQGVYDDISLIKENAKLNHRTNTTSKLPLILGILFIGLSVIGSLIFILVKKKKNTKKKVTKKSKGKKVTKANKKSKK